MWETEFDESLLSVPVIIHCPDESLAAQLMEILEEHGVRWGGEGNNPTAETNWLDHGEDTCYWVEGSCLTYAYKKYAEQDEYNEWKNHVKCTFYGKSSLDFYTASDSELSAFLGLGVS